MRTKLGFALTAAIAGLLAGGCSSGDRANADVTLQGDVAGGGSEDAAPPRSECDDGHPCAAGLHCVQGRCLGTTCLPGQRVCAGETSLKVCNEDGTAWQSVECPGVPCRDGHCEACTPGTRTCVGGVPAVCNETGTAFVPQAACAADQVCHEGQCLACVPGGRFCRDGAVYGCSDDGTTTFFVEDCHTAETGRACDDGVCAPLCEIDRKLNTSIGCEYWAVDLDNARVPNPNGSGWLDAANAPFAVIVANPGEEFTATVHVEDASGTLADVELAPGALHTIDIPPHNVDGSGIFPLAIHLVADAPIIAFQFNPLDNEDVFSNDASLLLPVNAAGSDYVAVSRPQSHDDLRGFVAVVGVEDDPVDVTVVPTAPVHAGPGVPALAPGKAWTTSLRKGEVLNLETNAIGADLTGTRVQASGRVVVFSGSEAANAPNTEACDTQAGHCRSRPSWRCTSNFDCPVTCCADHLEQQLPPIPTWGRHYVASRGVPRGAAPDVWRVVAAFDDTHVSTAPFQTAIPTLGAGEWIEFDSDTDFLVSADKPILVVQFLASEHAPAANNDTCGPVASYGSGTWCQTILRRYGVALGCQRSAECPNLPQPFDAGIGDPAMIALVPLEQWRSDYVFLAPDKYAKDFVNVVAPLGTPVRLDGKVIASEFIEPIGSSMFGVARLPLADGVHRLEADEPIEAIVYGWDQYVSYGYPAGLDLRVLSY